MKQYASIFVVLFFFGSSEWLWADWPRADFAVVKAYKFEKGDAIVVNGNLNPTTGAPVDLNGKQVKELLGSVNGKHPAHWSARCYTPHHGFIFFDKNGKIVDYLSICFTCGTYRASSAGTAPIWDLKAIEALFKQ